MAGLRAGARRVRPDGARGDGTRRPAMPAPTPVQRSEVRRPAMPTSPSSSSAAASPGCWPASGSRRPASRSPSSRRTRASAAPGTRTPTRARGSTSEITSTATASSRPTEWTHFFAEQPELQAYFQGVMDKHGIGPHVRWETEVTERELGRRHRDVDGDGARPGRHDVDVDRPRRDQRRRAAQPTQRPDDPRPGRLRRARLPLRRVGPLRRPDAASASP